MAISSETVAAAIRRWLRDNVAGNRAIPDEHPLIEDGLLTSLQTIELVLFLEKEFQIDINEDEVDEENFKSIAAITQLIAAKAV